MDGKKQVCIIGAGPSGLVSLRRVLNSPFLTGTIFEQKDDIGGVWNYKKGTKTFTVSPKNFTPPGGRRMDGNEGEDKIDPEYTTTMYDDLTCNFPYPLMQFLNFPHQPIPTNTFLTQLEMHNYLRNYAIHFHLLPHIHLNTSVISVIPENPITPTTLGHPGRWLVKTHNHSTSVYSTTLFDAVIVCVGKNAYPYQLPVLPGLSNFKGQTLHSKFYKNPEPFRNKSVVLIGLGPSSADLTLHLSKTAKTVTICHKAGGGFGLGLVPDNVRETKSVKMVTENGVLTEDMEEVTCDTIIFCTGFGLKFPFFSPDEIPVIGEKYVGNLYKMTVFTKRPTLAIFNLCYRSPELIMVEVQAEYFVRSLEGYQGQGSFRLPGYLEMEAAVEKTEDENQANGIPHSLWFQVGEFGKGTWTHFREMCKEIGVEEEWCERWPLLENLTKLVFLQRIFGKLVLYKKDKFQYISETVWEYVCFADKTRFPDIIPERIILSLDKETDIVTTTVEPLDQQEN